MPDDNSTEQLNKACKHRSRACVARAHNYTYDVLTHYRMRCICLNANHQLTMDKAKGLHTIPQSDRHAKHLIKAMP